MSGATGIARATTIETRLRRGAANRRETARDAAVAAEGLRSRIVEEGLADVYYGPVDSPFGTLHAALTKRGLVRLTFPEEDPEEMVRELAERLSPRIVEAGAGLEPVQEQLDRYFEGRSRRFQLKIDWTLVGPFGQRVLKRTAAIPYGGFLSYGEIAAEAGSPGGARAAGNALGSNPIPIVVPCHRVLRAGGALGGYGGGLERKRYLLELEGAL
ncbi:MAG TPA: methylated-DNA--[protein]-cysteine S-methyltransferase [Solirubrobacteraceae bacterium]|nr:methylated-DNA--[protein]-cysteine S-methyltransferase [Solirubrobacteraceae bacterium]